MGNDLLLAAAGLLAGAMNAAAGGGSFVTLPALIFAGVPSVPANASSTVALLPGALASAYGYRREFRPLDRVPFYQLVAVSLVGGLVGALLLLFTPVRTFDVIVPWLLLAGTVAFAFGRAAGRVLGRFFRVGPRALLSSQFVLGIYGGYFGGAVGIMMMAVWSLMGQDDIRAMSAARTLLVAATNVVAVLCFVAAGAVYWRETIVMLLAAVLGGYGGALLARQVPTEILRRLISVFNITMTAVVFWRSF